VGGKQTSDKMRKSIRFIEGHSALASRSVATRFYKPLNARKIEEILRDTGGIVSRTVPVSVVFGGAVEQFLSSLRGVQPPRVNRFQRPANGLVTLTRQTGKIPLKSHAVFSGGGNAAVCRSLNGRQQSQFDSSNHGRW